MDQKLKQLQAKVETDKGLAEKLFSLENPQDVQSLLKEQGLDFSLEEIDMLKEALVKALEKSSTGGELTDDDLEDVAGGFVLTATGLVAIIGAIVGAVTAAGAVTDQAVRSRW